MNIWLISDKHFGHKKIIEYENRPIDYERKIINNCKHIKQDDLLIDLGDTQWFGTKNLNNEFMHSLQCKKWLLKGNHDKQKSYTWFLNNGWDFVGESIVLKIHGKSIIFSHVPIEDHPYDINIHGHLHNEEHRGSVKDKGFLISLEYLNYNPIKLDRCITQFNKGKKYAIL